MGVCVDWCCAAFFDGQPMMNRSFDSFHKRTGRGRLAIIAGFVATFPDHVLCGSDQQNDVVGKQQEVVGNFKVEAKFVRGDQSVGSET